jgi:vitamin B12 transporter
MRERVVEPAMKHYLAVATGLVLPCLGFVSPGRAQVPPAAAGDPVIVTATRIAQPLGEVLEPTVVIGRAEIDDALAGDVGEILQFVAGLDVARAGGPGQPSSLFVRGTNSNHTTILIDGVRINPGTIGGVNLADLDPAVIERIEIVAGPRSTLYGSDAIGGVVNLITRHGGPSGLEALLSYGRFDSKLASLGGQLSGPAGDAGFIVANQESAGFPAFALDWRDRGFRNDSLLLHGDTAGGGLELGFRYYRNSGTSAYTLPSFNLDGSVSFPPADERFLNTVGAVTAGYQVTQDWHTKAILSRTVEDLRQSDLAGARVPDFDYTGRNTLDWQNDVRAGGHVVTFGAVLARERTNSLSFGSCFNPLCSAVHTSLDSYYLQDQVVFGHERLLLAVGDTQHSTFGHHATWNAEYGLELSDTLRLVAGAGTAFHAPDSTDRFSIFGGNPALNPETSRNLELGLHEHVAPGSEFVLTFFENRIDDLIVCVPMPTSADPFACLNENLGRARIRGVEATWQFSMSDWRGRLSGSYQEPIDLATHAQLVRRTRASFALELNRSVGAAQFGAAGLYAGDRADFDYFTGARVRLGGYALVDLHARYAPSAFWSIEVKIVNALDRRYQLVSDYNASPRAVAVSTRYAYR